GTTPPSFGHISLSEKANVGRTSQNPAVAPRAPTTEVIFLVAERKEWRPSRHARLAMSPRRDNSPNKIYCDDCCVYGHTKAKV
ncbi:hypothetical protein JG687_00003093, partial [Phytophthora cactorum]